MRRRLCKHPLLVIANVDLGLALGVAARKGACPPRPLGGAVGTRPAERGAPLEKEARLPGAVAKDAVGPSNGEAGYLGRVWSRLPLSLSCPPPEQSTPHNDCVTTLLLLQASHSEDTQGLSQNGFL